MSNFVENQYLIDVRIEGINDENEYEKYVDNKRELWEEIFTIEIDNSIVKIVEINP
jgi:hypothetical protein